MADIIIYDTNTGRVTKYLKSVNTPDYFGREDCLINPNLIKVEGVPSRLWRVENGTVRRQTIEERNEAQSEMTRMQEAPDKDNAVALLNILEKEPELLGRLCSLIKEHNKIHQS